MQNLAVVAKNLAVVAVIQKLQFSNYSSTASLNSEKWSTGSKNLHLGLCCTDCSLAIATLM